ncbi:MarR family transcriptional regulator [Mesorhizobium sp. L-8-10]|uniref:MarR family winged helix-turn-helix transcriptional regulator n=1 Tax=unclassified Mesorhizobium TaxID=325217 RepID=UPI00192800E8|nr:MULTISPECIES: MarR family transcriptional regulator [unclassified Mesorhizobium]BCH26582.1 MarR family transcriptional regulator [Mesorhizobium sp. L-8-3]BCH34567.1 MarR family transcriptional regulator [Mesorhizobium sp. L-8-10]
MTTEGIERLGFLLHDAARLLRKRFEARASGYGLSAAQWRLLVRLVKEEGVAQARLAELLEIEPISVSRLLDRMEEGGWIERRQDANDRRVRMIFPTARSRAAFAEVKSMAGEVYEDALAGLSPQARKATIDGLVAIVDNLSDGETPPSAEPGPAKDVAKEKKA